MIADIFGESGDEEEEEFTVKIFSRQRGRRRASAFLCFSTFFLLQGFNQEDLEGDKKQAKERQQQVDEDSDSDEGVDRSGQELVFIH